MSDSEKTPGGPPEEVEDNGQESSSPQKPKTTLVPDFGALLRQRAAEITAANKEEDEAPELKKGARKGKSTMVPTPEDFAELTRQTVVEETRRKKESDQKKKGAIIIPLKELRARLELEKDDDK